MYLYTFVTSMKEIEIYFCFQLLMVENSDNQIKVIYSLPILQHLFTQKPSSFFFLFFKIKFSYFVDFPMFPSAIKLSCMLSFRFYLLKRKLRDIIWWSFECSREAFWFCWYLKMIWQTCFLKTYQSNNLATLHSE